MSQPEETDRPGPGGAAAKVAPSERAGEASEVRARYARRAMAKAGAIDRYSFLQPDVLLSVQERQRAMLKLFTRLGWTTLADKRVLEVGCGSGGNLLELLRMGCSPERLAGVELLAERLEQARAALPESVKLWRADAIDLPVPSGSQDIVWLSTVFSSLLDDAYQQALAQAVWRWVKPGGGVLWYDFTIDNPHNPDVRGMPLSRVRALFPQASIRSQRVTLAPPLARRAVRLHPSGYHLLNLLPWLRTHVLAWIEKRPS